MLKEIFIGYKTSLLEKISDEFIDQKLKEQTLGNCESLERYENCMRQLGYRSIYLCVMQKDF